MYSCCLLAAVSETDSDAVPSSQVKKGQTTEKKVFSSGQLSSSRDQIRFVGFLKNFGGSYISLFMVAL